MTTHPEKKTGSGVQFFGEVSASISHEMKNVLAIINENVGLLEDLADIAEEGRPLDPERMKRTCRNMSKQIRRGDSIMKNLNAFAHSADQPVATVDLHQLTALIGSLAERPAALRNVSITVETPAHAMMLQTEPFLLEQLIWFCLKTAIGAAEPKDDLKLCLETSEDGYLLKIQGIGNPDRIQAQREATLPDELPARLGAKIHIKHQELRVAIGQP